MLWAGKRLSPEEEEHTRDVVAMLERTGNTDLAAQFARFLPEHDEAWSPDELELAAGSRPCGSPWWAPRRSGRPRRSPPRTSR
jgi:hypothetical protein